MIPLNRNHADGFGERARPRVHPTSALAGWSCVFGFNERWRKFEWGDVVGEAPTTARDGACAPRATAWSRGRLSRLGGRIKIKRAGLASASAVSKGPDNFGRLKGCKTFAPWRKPDTIITGNNFGQPPNRSNIKMRTAASVWQRSS
jgi:hypothetical protein